MKQSNAVITYYWDPETKEPDGFRSGLCRFLFKYHVVKYHDSWTILNRDEIPCGAFVNITGRKWLVDFLSWLTNLTWYAGENRVRVSTDENGEITGCEKLS